MRYIPNSPDERPRCSPPIGASSIDDLFATVPREVLSGSRPAPAGARRPRSRCGADSARSPRGTRTLSDFDVLPRRRPLRPPFAGVRLAAPPARRVPDRLHALPARGLAGDAHGDLRVPVARRAPDRDGRRERLDVRGGLGVRRGGPDGRAPDEEEDEGRRLAGRSTPSTGGASGRTSRTSRSRSSRFRLGADGATDAAALAAAVDDATFAVAVQSPNVFGVVESWRVAADDRAREGGARGRRRERDVLPRRPAAARRGGDRHRVRRGGLVRRPALVRRAARRLPRLPRRVQAPDPGPPRRQTDRRRRARPSSA